LKIGKDIKMAKRSIVLLMIVLCLGASMAEADVVFEDGGTHDISERIDDNIIVRDSPDPDPVPTTVNLQSGGRIYDDVSVYNTSIVNTYDGSYIRDDVSATDESTVNIHGGLIIDKVSVVSNSTLNVYNGQIRDGIMARQGGTVNFYDGWIENDLHGDNDFGENGSTINVYGGVIGDNLQANDDSIFNVYGGEIGGGIYANINSVINIYGTGFNYPYGPIGDMEGTLTGTLSNGDLLNCLFGQYDGSSINLMPLNEPPVANAGPDQTVEQESYDGTQVTLDGSGSTDSDSTEGTNDDIVSFDWYEGATYLGSGETLDYTFPLGTHTVTLVVTDYFGENDDDEVIITVVDTTPPEITLLEPDPSVLWPPNHKFVEVMIMGSALDNCDAGLAIDISDVSVEVIDAEGGDGGPAHDPDYEILAAGMEDGGITIIVALRAERSAHGDGRIYRITVCVTDASGNISTTTVDVTVPHDQGKGKK